MNLLINILLAISIAVITYAIEIKQIIYKKNLILVTGTPYHTIKKDLATRCASACKSNIDCFAYIKEDQTCQLFDSTTQLSYDTTKTSPASVFIDKTKLTNPIPGSLSSITGFYGSFGPLLQCNANTAVNRVKIWYDYCDELSTTDDGGVTEIEMICSSADGVLGNSLKQGHYDGVADIYEFTCPTGFFVWGIRSMMPTVTLGYGDDVGLMGLQVLCNDQGFTTEILSAGEGYTPSKEWNDWQRCDGGFSICGLSLKVEAYNHDNTHVNEVKIECCFL